MTVPFRIPNPASLAYAVGPQPVGATEPVTPWGGHQGMQFSAQPWPPVVGTINALANSAGTPRMRAPIPVVNRYSPLPSDYMFIGGFTGKSKG